MIARWTWGFLVVTLLAVPYSASADPSDITIRGRICDDEPLESRNKRNLELRKIIREEIAREQPQLHLGEIVFDLEGILPVLKPDSNSKPYSPGLWDYEEVPRVVQLKDDLALIEHASTLTWESRTSLVTLSQLEAASTAYLSKHPREAAAYTQRAFFRAMGSKLDAALSDATKAINLKPSSCYFLSIRAGLWLIRNQTKPAFDDFDELISLDKDNAEVYLMRAAVFLHIDDHDKALVDLSEAIRLGNKQADVFSQRGFIQSGKGNRAGAITDYSKALEHLPADEVGRSKKEALIRLWRGFTYSLINEDRLALADYEEAIRLQPDNPDAYGHRGVLWYRARDYDKAIDDFSAAIAREPSSYNAWMSRSRVRYVKKDFQGAIDDLTQAHLLKGDEIEPLSERAMVFDKLGNIDKANADRKEIKEIKQFRASRDEFRNLLR